MYFYQLKDDMNIIIESQVNNSEDFKDVVVILDASGSMSCHFQTLREVANTSLSAGCRVIFFSSGARCFSPEQEINWSALERSPAWAQTTCYFSALSMCAENCEPGISVLLMTDGSPNGRPYHEALNLLHSTLGDKGLVQSLFLGVPSESQRAILSSICLNATPKSTNRESFEATLRRFLCQTVRVESTESTTRVGNFHVFMSANVPDEARPLFAEEAKDGPFICALAASLLRFLATQKVDHCVLLDVVRGLNRWLSPLQSKHYGISDLIQQGRKLCEDLGSSVSLSRMYDVMNIAKVVALQKPSVNYDTELALLAEKSLVVMANNPQPWVRKAYLARSKVRSRVLSLVKMKQHLASTFGSKLVTMFPLKTVEVIANPDILDELARLARGDTTTPVDRATLVIQCPQALNVSFGQVTLCRSLEEQRENPSLFLVGGGTLGAACVQLCASAVLDCLSTTLSPFLLLNGVWELITGKERDHERFQLAKEVLVELRSYAVAKCNAFNFFPNSSMYPFGHSLSEGLPQVASVQAALLAPLLCDEKSQEPEHEEFMIRSLMPALVACRSTWTTIWEQLCKNCIFVNFNCSPEKLVAIIQGASTLNSVVQACVDHIRVDTTGIDVQACLPELISELQRCGNTPSPEGIARPKPSWDEILRVHEFLTGNREPPTRTLLRAVARFLVSLHVTTSPHTISHLQLNNIFKDIDIRVGNKDSFTINVIPSNPVSCLLKSRIRDYALLEELPADLDSLLSIARIIHIPQHVCAVIDSLLQSQERLNAKEGTVLLSYAGEEEKRRKIIRAIVHDTLTLDLIKGKWCKGWKKLLLEEVCYELVCDMLSLDYIQCLSACVDAVQSPTILENLLLYKTNAVIADSPHSMKAAFYLVCYLENRATFDTKSIAVHLALLAEAFSEHKLLPFFLDRCIPVEDFCMSLEDLYIQVLSNDKEPANLNQQIADSIATYHPALRKDENSALGRLLRAQYCNVMVSATVNFIVRSWISQIGPVFDERSAFLCVFPKLTRGHTWIRKQCNSESLSLLLELRKAVSEDGGEKLGPRMLVHNTALEVLIWCVAQKTKQVPSVYQIY